MATFNANANTTNAADVLSSSVAAAAAATYLLPSNTTPAAAIAGGAVGPSGAPLHLEQFGAIHTPAQYMNAAAAAAAAAVAATPLHHHHHHHHQQTNSSSSYTFVQIKREPCQVSEISSNNCHQQQQQQQQHHHHHQTASTSMTATGLGTVSSSSLTSSATSKTMSSSTLTTLVKIEASSPKVTELEKSTAATGISSMTATAPLPLPPPLGSTSNSVPIGIAVARKRPQETTTNQSTLSTPTTLPLTQPLNKDMNCFGIRVADLGATSCGNLYFTGNGDLMTSSATAEELAFSAAGVNRAPSTFWQYPNPLPIESVISMSPATVGLQYAREPSRGQVVLLPAAPAALGISNFPILTPTDPFQQAAAAAAFVWPSAYIPQATAAGAQAAALQPSPNFLFPSMGAHSTLSATPSYASTLQLYLAAAAATATTGTTAASLCQQQHSNQQQQQQTSTSSTTTTNSSNFNFNLSHTGGAGGGGGVGGASSSTSNGSSSTSMSSSSTSTSSRFLSLAAAATTTTQPQAGAVTTLPLPAKSLPVGSQLLLPPTALKMEEFNASEYKHTTLTTTQPPSLSLPVPPLVPFAPPPPQTTALNYEMRDKMTTTTSGGGGGMMTPTHHQHLLDLQANNAQQALNLMRLPTPPTSALIDSVPHHQILFQATAPNTPTPALLNLSMHGGGGGVAAAATASLPTPTASIGPPTPAPAPCDEAALNFKLQTPLTPQTPSRLLGSISNGSANSNALSLLPQMQDVNIQTDTPVCSEDENSSCPLKSLQSEIPLQAAQEQLLPIIAQPLELIKSSAESITECHINNSPSQMTTATTTTTSEMPQQQSLIDASSSLSLGVPAIAAPEDLTGLELLSNISTNSSPMVRVKQEPIDHHESMEVMVAPVQVPQTAPPPLPPPPLVPFINKQQAMTPPSPLQPQQQQQQQQPLPMEDVAPPEPLGGLKLLCALAEQRIQEEVVQGSSLFTTSRSPSPPAMHESTSVGGGGFGTVGTTGDEVANASASASGKTMFSFAHQTPTTSGFRLETSSSFQVSLSSSNTFPSMEGIELPSPSTTGGGGGGGGGGAAATGGDLTPVKRKKHKHSKSSSSASDSRKSSRCSKKSKKKRKHSRQLATESPADDELVDQLHDEQLQTELRSALHTLDPSYAQRFGQEVFSIMDNNMRMRLADITRQYRKKKRKLDEISKHKKKKKCSKLLQQQQQSQQTQGGGGNQIHPQPAQLTLTSSLSALHTGSSLGTSSPLRDYKFPKFSTSNLQATSFLRFPEKTHSFPPPAATLGCENNEPSLLPSISPSTSSFVRLEPSALDAANNARNAAAAAAAAAAVSINNNSTTSTSATSGMSPSNGNGNGNGVRAGNKHPASDKPQQIARKERKLMAKAAAAAATTTTTAAANRQQQATGNSSNHVAAAAAAARNAIDRELQLTSDHLYRDETRVLTDMGGLFYAGVMKPLRPPDVYAITLDGERGNKSHVMSREDILKDTILEVAPKSVESVPVGTRLCAYWSQQYRCLYPGRAIESETSVDGSGAVVPLTSTATPRDFVSVEFDDGDSGRIRLQNIRLLLSDYPIAEYNDNPLYSLGKQKRGGGAGVAGSCGGGNLRGSDGPTTTTMNEHSSLSGDDHHGHHGFAMSNDNMTSLAATMELFTQRSEKKRLKSLKKLAKTQNNGNNNGQTPTSNGCHNGGAGAGSGGDGTELTTITTAMGDVDGSGNRIKHHKHKKRKKHKKHHRKTNNNDNEGQSYLTNTEDVPTAVELNAGETITPVTSAGVTEIKAAAVGTTQQRIKMEAQSAAAAAAGAAVKVKTEQLDMEEETTSNLMSEISDEAKGDELVEHNNSKGSSKIAAFLPERQLWGWFGTAYRKAGVKGRARKQFYKTIKRGKETITVGDCAVFLSTGRPDRPYIGRIESMWETTTGNKVVRVAWFYHPEETTGCPNLKYPGALFESPHEDENDVQTISHRCEVLQFPSYYAKFGSDSKQYQSIYDNNDTYYLAGHYNPRLLVLKLQDDIPTLEELQNTTTTTTITNNNNNNNTTTEN